MLNPVGGTAREKLAQVIKFYIGRRGWPTRRVADATSASVQLVEAWQSGTAVPNGAQWGKLRNMIHRDFVQWIELWKAATAEQEQADQAEREARRQESLRRRQQREEPKVATSLGDKLVQAALTLVEDVEKSTTPSAPESATLRVVEPPAAPKPVDDGFDSIGDDEPMYPDLAEPVSRKESAMAFLRNFLREGPQPSAVVQKRAASLNIAKITLRRAYEALGVQSQRVGFGANMHAIWTLPDAATPSVSSEPSQSTEKAEPTNVNVNATATNTNEPASNPADRFKGAQERREWTRNYLRRYPDATNEAVHAACKAAFGFGIDPTNIRKLRQEVRGELQTPDDLDIEPSEEPEVEFVKRAPLHVAPAATPTTPAFEASDDTVSDDVNAAIQLLLDAIPNLQTFSLTVDANGEPSVDFTEREIQVVNKRKTFKVTR